jgi:hypothetical protein
MLGSKRRGSYLTRGEVLVAIGAKEDLIKVIGARSSTRGVPHTCDVLTLRGQAGTCARSR